MLTSTGYAYGEYYIEVGSEFGEEEAMLQWQQLSKKYPETLGKLEFYPTTIVHKDTNKVSTHIQAGPLHTKLDAYSICGQLFDDNMPCFIVEGMDHSVYARQDATTENKPEMLPWLMDEQPDESKETGHIRQEPVTINTRPKEEKGLFSWILSGFKSDEEDITPARNNRYHKGRVEVAEAIRVPLSSDTIASSPVTFTNDKGSTFTPSEIAQANAQTMMDQEGWLVIQNFISDDRASGFWQSLRDRDPIQTAGFKVRIVRPVVQEEGVPSVRLHIGPFAGLADANRFCKTIVQTKNERLQCRYLSEAEVAAMGDSTVSTEFSHTDRYYQRHKEWQMARRLARQSLEHPVMPQKVFWLHVATAKSQMEALQTWDAMRQKHADLLEGLRSSVSATLSQDTQYVLRIGPLESNSAASELCALLQKRQIFCRVYSNL